MQLFVVHTEARRLGVVQALEAQHALDRIPRGSWDLTMVYACRRRRNNHREKPFSYGSVRGAFKAGKIECMRKNDLTFDPSLGYPQGSNIYYECGQRGAVIPSQPDDGIGCSCRNIFIDVDAGRVSVKDHSQFKVFTK